MTSRLGKRKIVEETTKTPRKRGRPLPSHRSSPFDFPNLLDGLDENMYPIEEMKAFLISRQELLRNSSCRPGVLSSEEPIIGEKRETGEPSDVVKPDATPLVSLDKCQKAKADIVVIIDSDDDDDYVIEVAGKEVTNCESTEKHSELPQNQKSSHVDAAKKTFESDYKQNQVNTEQGSPEEIDAKESLVANCEDRLTMSQKNSPQTDAIEDPREIDGSSYVADVHVSDKDDDSSDNYMSNEHNNANWEDLTDIWNEMRFGLECSKEVAETPVPYETKEEQCDHSYVLKDDIGEVCITCGVVKRAIDTIIEYNYTKTKRSTRTYASDLDSKNIEAAAIAINFSEGCFTSGICAHPRHMKKMKPHQIEGFNFLSSNLVTENPGGCILAHAPGSGKTFMIISFMQSFLAKYPHAKPLVVLPKGILATWKNEFQRWQVEHFALFDFYTVKADNRAQQLEVLKKWVEERSILFLGYKQFSTIVCDRSASKISFSCQDLLLKVPSILILDEGHTPRNENTDVLQSLARVQTPRKVVLSGTLYQNHVKEVFNILNLVRPKFLKLDTSKSVVKRILSRAPMSDFKTNIKAGTKMVFYDIVEHTLQKSEDNKMKVSIIKDLREMTSKVLHYYKGDFLDELPGLVDFTVFLNLSSKQESEVQKLKKFDKKFKVASVGSAVYLHPNLNTFSDIGDAKMAVSIDAKMDEILEEIDIKDGVKAKFFLNMINLCESSGEKLLVFSQYLIPLKFLEKLAMKVNGWTAGRELFTITGDSTAEDREWSMERFNNSSEARVFFGSIRACGEGISLVGASRIIILDVPLNPSVTRQAIGRAFRPGQNKKVYAYRLVAAESPEEADHGTCFKKELISKMWFEWNEYLPNQAFEVAEVEIDECGDPYFDSPFLKEDVKFLYKR